LPCDPFHALSLPKQDKETMSFSILVCIKTVPDPASAGDLAITGRWIDETTLAWCMNHYDAHALEAALSIKDQYSDVTVDALSAGPERVRATIRRAMAMGADAGIHLDMDAADPPTIALAIAHYAKNKNYDLILTGAISEDAMHGVTGPMIAAALDLPCAAAAMRIIPDRADRSLRVTCEMEGGMTESGRLSCPALVTVQTGRQVPRYPSLSNTLRSRRQAVERLIPPDAAGPIPPLERLCVAFPRRATFCQIIEGTPVRKADQLLRLFGDNGWLK
jgi:electron transfer flavoprotein beta subunit